MTYGFCTHRNSIRLKRLRTEKNQQNLHLSRHVSSKTKERRDFHFAISFSLYVFFPKHNKRNSHILQMDYPAMLPHCDPECDSGATGSDGLIQQWSKGITGKAAYLYVQSVCMSVCHALLLLAH